MVAGMLVTGTGCEEWLLVAIGGFHGFEFLDTKLGSSP
jgi:hypothetical protein